MERLRGHNENFVYLNGDSKQVRQKVSDNPFAAITQEQMLRDLAISRRQAKEGDVEDRIMYNTFNMGIGMVLAADKHDVEEIRGLISDVGGTSYIIGSVIKGDEGVKIC